MGHLLRLLAAFVNWLYNFDASTFEEWLLAGDFNFIRTPDDRNKPGGCINSMLLFNDLIQHLDVIELPFEGRRFAWSNMQDDPLLENWTRYLLRWLSHLLILLLVLQHYLGLFLITSLM